MTRMLSAFVVMITAFSIPAAAQSRRYTNNTITVYANPNFSGQSASFRDDVPDLRQYNLNDKISSVDIPNGEAWEVCQDVNYNNICRVFSGSVSDLRDLGWNDRISSIRRVGSNNSNNGIRGRRGEVLGQNNGNAGLVLYDRPNFRGNTTVVTGESSNIGLGNRLGSVEVRSGRWELCDRTGRCATVTQDVANLSELGLTGRVTSARRLNGFFSGRGNTNSGSNNGRRRF